VSLAENLVAAATLALAAVGAVQTWVTRQAVVATRKDVREARLARVDATAPRGTFLATDCSWPPHTPVSSDFTGRTDLTHETAYVLPRDAAMRVYVAGHFEMVNEGRATALVTLPEDVIVLPRSYPDGPPTDPPCDLETSQQLRSVKVRTLRPGESVPLWVRGARPVGEWVGQGDGPVPSLPPLVKTLVVEDTFADGVVDRTELELRGHPLVPSGRDDGCWIMNPLLPGQPSAAAVILTVGLTQRVYRGDGPSPAWKLQPS